MSEFEVDFSGVKKGSDIVTEEQSDLPELPRGRPAPALETYISEARKAARIEGERKHSRLPPPANQKELNERKQDVASRVELAGEYARYRWYGYVNGEIASL